MNAPAPSPITNPFAPESNGVEWLADKAPIALNLENVAGSDTCKHEIVRHDELDIFGTQFHPEMTEDGHALIESFVLIH